MPRVRRRPKTRRSDLTDEQWDELTDSPASPYWDGASAFTSPLLRRAAWIEHRDAILAARAKDDDAHEWRLKCWWDFDAPRESRRVVARRGPADAYELRPADAKGQPVYESDLVYLERHKLLTPEETAYLAELREANAAIEHERVRQHPDALGPTTLRKVDREAEERAYEAGPAA